MCLCGLVLILAKDQERGQALMLDGKTRFIVDAHVGVQWASGHGSVQATGVPPQQTFVLNVFIFCSIPYLWN